MKQKFIQWLGKHFKVWGVCLESSLPPEFIVTIHAEERMKVRCGWNPEKMMKITTKAWFSTEKVPSDLRNLKEYQDQFKFRNRVYKRFMGKTFVFATKYNYNFNSVQKTLITLF